jgi:nitroreductase
MMGHPCASRVRAADYPIAPFFIERWSPRAFRPEPIAETELMTMLEAARWAASSSNAQPWRFVYALRGADAWRRLLDLLAPSNREWAQHASALVFFVSYSLMRSRDSNDLRPSPTHSYDTGAASGYFALQAHLMGWRTHGMYGFDHARAIEVLRVPRDHHVEAVYAVGRTGNPDVLPEALKAREFPSGRLPLTALAREGAFDPQG